jgi:hypothetical protein
MNLKKIYISSPISGLTYQDLESQRVFSQTIASSSSNLNIFCPATLVSSGSSPKFRNENKTYSPMIELSGANTPKSCLYLCRKGVKECDIFLLNLLNSKEKSIGCIFELCWAKEFDKPIIVLIDPDNVHQHSFVLETATHVVNTLDQCIECINFYQTLY